MSFILKKFLSLECLSSKGITLVDVFPVLFILAYKEGL